MGHGIDLTSADGHVLEAWVVEPPDQPTGGLLVIQEIFGLNSHIRSVCDRFADAGFLTIAPAVFDRIGKGLTVGYEDIQQGRDLIGRLDPHKTMLDFTAALEYVTRAGKVGVVGFCWGGAQAYRCAAALPVAAAVCYYGGGIHAMRDIEPACPVMFHFGAEDPHIPREQVDAVAAANPDAALYLYEGAGHGFNCDQRRDFDEEASALAFERSRLFLAKYLAD